MFSVALALAVACSPAPSPTGLGADEKTALVCPAPRVLVFSKTAGFRHDSIPAGIKAIQGLAAKHGFTVDATEDGAAFTAANLAKYDGVVFLNTTGDVLDAGQQTAFEGFVESGGGYVGIHAASDCEYDWPWYGRLVGGYFVNHPAIQQAVVRVEDRAHPSSTFLPDEWTRTDEWYNFKANPRPNVRVLATLDEATYQGGTMNGDHPIMWCLDVGKGRSWYTNLGHRIETFSEELFLRTLYEGLLWSCQGKRPTGAVDIDWADERGWEPGSDGTLSNGRGRKRDLVSKAKFGDQLVHVEFKLEPGSNSGVYLQGQYELQILDSYGKAAKDLKFSDCGGIYERWVNNVGTGGTPPLTNAVRKPGEWNTYDILFRAPRFGPDGKKTEDAVFVEVRLNGVVVQSGTVVPGPTGGALFDGEVATGPLRFQGDHGPVTYRNVWVLPTNLGSNPSSR